MYEFTQAQNVQIQQAATAAKRLGYVTVAIAVANLAHGAGQIVGSIISVVIALALLSAGKSLQQVVDTEGDDIAHVMSAVDHLTKVLGIRIGLLIFMMLFVGLIFGLVIVVGVDLMAAATGSV